MGDVIYEEQSPFQKIRLSRRRDGKLLLELDGAYQFLSGPDEELYHDALAGAPARRLRGPVNALVLGGGDGLAARDLLSCRHVRKVTLVELDPKMIEMSSTVPEMRRLNRDVFRHPRLRTVVEDARSFIRREHPELWNLVVVDFPDPAPGLEDLYSEKLYRNVVMNLDGLRGIVSVQAADASTPRVKDRIVRNLRAATHVPPRVFSFRGWDTIGGFVVRGGMGSL